LSAPTIERVIVFIMDSVGIGEMPDAAEYGDAGSHTLGHIAKHVGGAVLPTLQELGLGNIAPLAGLPPAASPAAAFGKCAEASAGKDTATGHWEMAGLKIDHAFPLFPDGFSEEILEPFRKRTGRGVLGNRPASGTKIIEELGAEHMRSGDLIVYTSGDSVFQIAAHEALIPPDKLYEICKIAREILDPYRVARVIARPFVGSGPGDYTRTYNRKDFAMPPPAPTVLEAIAASENTVVGVGKISDIYCGRGITESVHTEGNTDSMKKVQELMGRVSRGLIMVNLIDFDSKYGHRRNPEGYYECLREFDAHLSTAIKLVRPERDLVLITADHGNDPTFPGSDHTREYIPLLAYGPAAARGVNLGTRSSFADIGATLADVFRVKHPGFGTSFLPEITEG